MHRSCTGGGTSAGPSRSSASSCCSAKASSDSRAPPLSGSCCKQADNCQACSLHRHSADVLRRRRRQRQGFPLLSLLLLSKDVKRLYCGFLHWMFAASRPIL